MFDQTDEVHAVTAVDIDDLGVVFRVDGVNAHFHGRYHICESELRGVLARRGHSDRRIGHRHTGLGLLRSTGSAGSEGDAQKKHQGVLGGSHSTSFHC